jgi:hypothetical protein
MLAACAAAALAGLGLYAPAGPAAASPVAASPVAASPSDVPAGDPPTVQLVSQTPWLVGHGTFSLHLAVAHAPAKARLQVEVYDHEITRTGFDDAASGHLSGFAFYQASTDLSALTPDSTGAYAVDLPVDTQAPDGSPFSTVPIGETGVFPVQVSITDSSGAAAGDPLVTFMVFASQTAAKSGYHPLAVSLIIPVTTPLGVDSSGDIEPPGQAEASRLLSLASTLDADSGVHATLLADPSTVSAVSADAATSSGARATLRHIAGATDGGLLSLAPASYVPLSLGAFEASGLGGEVERQLAAGATVLSDSYRASPDDTTWVVNGPVDPATLQVMVAHGARQIVVPDSDLSAQSCEITCGKSSVLQTADDQQVTVFGADSVLTADFTRDESPALAANQLLAELAMIWTEAPGLDRGVAVMPPAGWSVSPTFIATLLSGLSGHPLVTGVTAGGLFGHVGQTFGTRTLLNAVPASLDDPNEANSIQRALQSMDALSSLLSGSAGQVDTMRQRLLVVESSAVPAALRDSVLSTIISSPDAVTRLIRLPPPTSITLTSTKGQLPITILATGSVRATVQLRLTSNQLIFRSFAPPSGSCQVLPTGTEVCTLLISTRNTTLKVPVETRSSGVFHLDVGLFTPNGLRIGTTVEDSVRSTAVSGVAVVLIVVALLSLLVWWGRDLHRGRRARGLAPSPVDDPTKAAEVRAEVEESLAHHPLSPP